MIKTWINKFSHFWQKRSVFTTTFVLLSVMSLATAIVMFVYVNWIVTAEQDQRIYELNSSELERAGEDIDIRMEMLGQNMSQVLEFTDIVSIMVHPSQMDSDKTLRIVSELSGCVSQNTLVKEAFLYLPTTDEVYSSSRNFLSRENFAYESEIDRYLAIREEGRDGSLETVVKVFYLDGRLFFVGDFCVPNFIGAVFFEIDREKLAETLSGGTEDSVNSFLILDEEGQVIVGDEALLETVLPYIDGEKARAQGEGSSQAGEGPVLVRSSSSFGFRYVLYINPGAVAADYRSALWMILPFLIAYALFAEIFSLSITRRIYRPINRLMQVTTEKREDLNELLRENGSNELAFLEEAFMDTLEENTQHKELLASISHDVAEQTFRSVLGGKAVNEEYVVSTLRGIGMEEYLGGRYMALAGLLVMDQNRELSSVEIGLYQRSIVSLMEELGGAEYIITAFFQDRDIMALVFCFREDASVTSMKQCVTECIDTVNRFTENLPYSVAFGKGKVYSDLISLRFSWQEAVDEVKYLSYLSDEPEVRPPEEETSEEDYDRRYFRERGEQVAEAAEKETREAAEKLAFSLIQEILDCGREKYPVYWELVSDIMVEKMIDSHISAEEIDGMGAAQIPERIVRAQEEDEIRQIMQEFFSQAIWTLQNSSRRNRYRYVESAREYIESHYSDGNLSLQEVSDAIGISAPYLSGIFNEINQGSFSAYLKNYRVTQAKNFLEQTTLNVAEIGYKCGFNSAQSFSRAFKKETGFSPGKYRESCADRRSASFGEKQGEEK